MKVKYICVWNKDKQKTWRGTTLSLYRALNKKETTLDCGFILNFIVRLAIKLCSLNISVEGIKFLNRFNILSTYMPYVHAILKEKTTLPSEVILQIGDLAKFSSPYYIYQDLSIDSLIYLREKNQTAFKFSNYQNIPDSALKRRKKWQKDLYANATGVFTMSEWLKDNLIYFSCIDREKVHHVGGGININPTNIKPDKKQKNKILFVGRDFKRKAGYLVYDSFKILKNKYLAEAELYIIGPSKNPIKDCVEGVNFIGEINNSELSKYFNMCDIFCMPSYFEAYGLVFIEALAFGLPCIGRNDFAMKEFINDGFNGYLIENDNDEELAFKMYKLLFDETIRCNVINNRDIYLTKYTWDAVAERIIYIINSDLSK